MLGKWVLYDNDDLHGIRLCIPNEKSNKLRYADDEGRCHNFAVGQDCELLEKATENIT